ncbi:hypothetical protein BJ912DRAFT_863521, partial [Pholiota molesta]
MEQPPLPDNTELDKLYIETLASRPSDEQFLSSVYGGVHVDSTPTNIYVYSTEDRISNQRHAAAGIYWGESHRNNMALRAHGKQTADRAELLALHYIVRKVRVTRAIQVFTTRRTLYTALLTHIRQAVKAKWNIPNGDIVASLADLIKRRVAAITLIQIDIRLENKSLNSAKALAERG